MKLGFVSAIFPEWSVEEVFAFAEAEGFACVELMCWPPGQAERRYGGVTHVDVTEFHEEATAKLIALSEKHHVEISGLGYYPNPLDPDPAHRAFVQGHIQKLIAASARLGHRFINTFIGRDWKKSIDENWPTLQEIWTPLVAQANQAGMQIAIEHCPMLFSKDEWPGGKNLAISPAVWKRLFQEFPTFALNFDPSHLIFQFIDIERAIREFGSKIIHVHAKDTQINPNALYEVGILGLGWHTPKLPGRGDVDWSKVFTALVDVGYSGAVCIEVEDRDFEATLELRKESLRVTKRYLEPLMQQAERARKG